MIRDPLARTSSGQVRGMMHDGILLFNGVPYAAAPIGELRFAPPAPAPAWQGVRDAKGHGGIPPQTRSRLDAVMGEQPQAAQSEDCLTLTIATPAADNAARPVLVIFPGGAWMTGAGSLDWFDGRRLAHEGDIVVVSVNYRLGALGYFCRSGLSEGNFGAADQYAALAWVRDNIAAFGGDPGRVTLLGQSAGATSIGRLMLDPDAASLFQQAILQSGGFGRQPTTSAEASVRGDRLCALLDIDPDATDAMDRLRALPVARILEAQTILAEEAARPGETAPAFIPVLDDMTSADGLIDAIAAAGRGKRFIVGATREECHAFFAINPAMQNPDPGFVAGQFTRTAGSGDALARYRARRPGGSAMDLLSDLASDHTFLWPAMRLADAFARHGVTAYAYRFDWSPPASRLRACHTIELPFVFGNFEAWTDAPMLEGANPEEMEALSAFIRAAWIDFVHGGAPSEIWPRYGTDLHETLRLGTLIEVAGDPAGLRWRNQ